MGASQREVNDRVRELLRELAGDTAHDPVERVRMATAIGQAAETYRLAAIGEARGQEVDWSEIGRAMGITGQAAGRHYRRNGGTDTRPGAWPYPGSRGEQSAEAASS